ncbi:MAG: metalloprotease [Euryarchaeota archaeon]|nr:metalloprotease [Euryarchaeota archaeon]
MSLWIYAALFLGFSWLLMGLMERKGLLPGERYAVILLLRTQNGRELISRIARYGRFWRAFGNLGVVLGVFLMFLMMASFVYSIYVTYFQGVSIITAKPVIPGVTIPLWYGIIGLVTVLVVHEFSHGIMARSEGISLKSLGAVFLSVFPVGAFVEPDEEEMKKSSRLARLRVYSAGSFANIILALVAGTALLVYVFYVFDPGAVQVGRVVEGSPAHGVLQEGMVIESIGGRTIGSMQDFQEAAADILPGEELVIGTDRGYLTLRPVPSEDDPERGFVGIQVHPRIRDTVSRYLGLAAPLVIFYSLYWISFLNQGIGLINLAPLHIGIAATDGHHILRELLARFLDEGLADRLSFIVSFSMVFLLLYSISAPAPGLA